MGKILLFVFLSISIFSSSQCNVSNTTFKPGEKLEFQVYFHWGLVWINAAEVFFTVKSDSTPSPKTYKLVSYGWSHKKYDWIFRVRDYYETTIRSSDLKPVFYKRKTSEGGFNTDNQYKFDYKQKKIYTQTENSDKPFSKDTFELKPCVFDVLSAVYYARNIDFSDKQIGDKIPITFIVDNNFYKAFVVYLGKETIKARNDKSYRCIKLSAIMPDGTIFTKGEGHYVWVTDDKNHIPILVEAKIFLGSIKAYFEKGTNIRHPEDALQTK
ncbi:MAG: DUF3108 domain-containing protein [Bacteroidales bacterium]|nr:DUF3108 domain-containing protein [Bacteroidales bacterium]